ncbi:hypothetical protein [Paraburkholderia sacchari]|uniref:hypothetical protein n=1 Tax=Paraburkholderia sacchari TaxID=159450 RepID=UPI001BD11D2B|nr:hypothetical protein [Paraburkholderia sacchari]
MLAGLVAAVEAGLLYWVSLGLLKASTLSVAIFLVGRAVAMTGGSPALGWISGHAGLRAVFLVSAVVFASTASMAFQLLRRYRGVA